MAYKIFIDTNIYLDAFLERTPDWKYAEMVLQMGALEQVSIYTSANNLVNTIYALKKLKLSYEEVIELIELSLSYSQLAATSNSSFRHALRSGFPDLEDAVQYYTALDIKGIDYFITSNVKDYKKATLQLPVVAPKQFVSLLNKKKR